MVIQLREIIGSPFEQKILEIISDFSCMDADVEDFLRSKAYQHELRNKSRTYLIISDNTFRLISYFTLSLKSLEFDESVSKNTIKNIDGFNEHAKSAPVILIGQLGKDKRYYKEISGAEILNLCLKIVYDIHKLIGGRIVLLESVNNEKVIEFYKTNDFSVLKKDKGGTLIQMIRTL